MTQTKLTEAQADALRWIASPLTIATPRTDVLRRLHTAGLAVVSVKRVVRGTTGTAKPVADYSAELTEAGKLALDEANARREAPFRIRTGAR